MVNNHLKGVCKSHEGNAEWVSAPLRVNCSLCDQCSAGAQNTETEEIQLRGRYCHCKQLRLCIYIKTPVGLPGGSAIKNLPAMQKTWVWPLGREDGNPLQYSCLENPMDRGAWWATVHRVSKSRTQLKQLTMHAYLQRSLQGAQFATLKCLSAGKLFQTENKDPETQAETLTSPHLPKWILMKGLFPENSDHQRYLWGIQTRCGGRTLRDLCPFVSAWPGKHVFTKCLFVHIHVNCCPPLWGPLTTTPNVLVFSWRRL